MKPIKLMDHVRAAIRCKHYSIRTEKSYTYWIRRYILFHNKQHPDSLGETEVVLDWIDNIEWSRRTKRLPVVFTIDEVSRILLLMEGNTWLMASLLYGSRLRLQECLRLRIMDVDFGYRQIIVRDENRSQPSAHEVIEFLTKGAHISPLGWLMKVQRKNHPKIHEPVNFC
ncbi:MAG: phage integrase N-terminal SAM-like domain-containing protein [bacterium]